MSRNTTHTHYRLTDFDALLQQNGGETPPELQEHLDHCEQCTKEFERYQYLHSLCTLPVETWQSSPTRHEMFQARSQFLYNVSESFEKNRGIIPLFKYLYTGWRPMAAAAAFAVAVFFFGPVHVQFDDPNPVPNMVAELEDVMPTLTDPAPEPSDSFAELLDENDTAEAFLAGSRVRLASNRNLDVEVDDLGFFFLRPDPKAARGAEIHFDRKEKSSVLELSSGMVALSIDKLTKDRRFSVATDEALVVVKGTQFAVWRENVTGETVVVVQKGKVAVHIPDSEEGQPIYVSSHNGIRLNSEGGIEVLSLSDVPEITDLLSTLPDERHTPAPVLSPELLKPQASAGKLLAEAREQFRSRKLGLAARTLDRATRLPAEARLKSEIAFFSAEVATADRRYEDALAGFEKAEQLDRKGTLSPQALYRRGQLLHDRLGQKDKGRQVWKLYLDRYPEGSLYEEALFSLTSSYFTAGLFAETKRYAQRYLDKYPDGYRVSQIHEMLEEIDY